MNGFGKLGGEGPEAVDAGVAEAADQSGADDGAVGETGHGARSVRRTVELHADILTFLAAQVDLELGAAGRA